MILGLYLAFSPPTFAALSYQVGLANQQTTLDKNYVLPLNESNYANLPVVLSPQDNLSVSMQANPGGIDFLFMNSGNYSLWSARNVSSYQVYSQSKLNVTNYSFSFSGYGSNQDYYLVFVSPGGRSGNTDVLLHMVVQSTSSVQEAGYVPFLIMIIGVALIGMGLFTRKKSEKVERGRQVIDTLPEPTTIGQSSTPKCQFCGASMNKGTLFCPACKRSQE